MLKAERAIIPVSDNIKIIGSYYPVKSTDFPAVILLHMLGRNRGDWNIYARHLQKEGIAVLSIDLRGHGESTNYFKIYWRNFWNDDYKKYIPDLEQVLKYLKEQGADQKKIGIMGVGIGANTALNFAALHSQISTVVLVDPGLEYQGIQIAQSVKGYGERPMYIICNGSNKYALSSSQKIQRMAKGKIKMDIYQYNNSWPYLFNNQRELQNSVTTWFKETLLGYIKLKDTQE